MSRKNRKHQDDNQLKFDFRQASAELHRAVLNFTTATERLVMANREVAPPVIVPPQDNNLRREVVRVARIVADQSGIDHHTVWDMGYLHLQEITGFHAVEVAQRMKFKVHLDAVQHCNMLSALHHVFLRMLHTPAYQRKVELAQLAELPS